LWISHWAATKLHRHGDSGDGDETKIVVVTTVSARYGEQHSQFATVPTTRTASTAAPPARRTTSYRTRRFPARLRGVQLASDLASVAPTRNAISASHPTLAGRCLLFGADERDQISARGPATM
jgi:hypothetical protein